MTELVSLECPQAIKEQVLSMVQSWSQAFSSDPELSGVVEVYNDLKMKGTVFPEPSTQDQILVTHSPSHSQVSGLVLPSFVMFCFSPVLSTLSTTLVLFLCMAQFLMYVPFLPLGYRRECFYVGSLLFACKKNSINIKNIVQYSLSHPVI